MHHLVRARRLGMAREAGLILIRRRQHAEQGLEWPQITVVLCCRERLLDQMIARDECGVCPPHDRDAFGRGAALG